MFAYITSLFSFAFLTRAIPGSEKLHPPARMSTRRRAYLERWERVTGRTHPAIAGEESAFQCFEKERDRSDRRARAYHQTVGPALAKAGAPIPFDGSAESFRVSLASGISYKQALPFLSTFGGGIALLGLTMGFAMDELDLAMLFTLVGASLVIWGLILQREEWSVDRDWSSDIRDVSPLEDTPPSVLRWVRRLQELGQPVEFQGLVQTMSWAYKGHRLGQRRVIAWQVAIVHDDCEYVLGYWRV